MVDVSEQDDPDRPLYGAFFGAMGANAAMVFSGVLKFFYRNYAFTTKFIWLTYCKPKPMGAVEDNYDAAADLHDAALLTRPIVHETVLLVIAYHLDLALRF